jgi:VanZ family protein
MMNPVGMAQPICNAYAILIKIHRLFEPTKMSLFYLMPP